MPQAVGVGWARRKHESKRRSTVPFATLTDPNGPLVTTVQSAFESIFADIHGKLNQAMAPEQLALSRASAANCKLDPALGQHFINHWLRDASGGKGGYSNSFPKILVADVEARIKKGFQEAVNLAVTEGTLPITCTCEWRQASDETTFEVLAAFNRKANHLTILLVTPKPI